MESWVASLLPSPQTLQYIMGAWEVMLGTKPSGAHAILVLPAPLTPGICSFWFPSTVACPTSMMLPLQHSQGQKGCGILPCVATPSPAHPMPPFLCFSVACSRPELLASACLNVPGHLGGIHSPSEWPERCASLSPLRHLMARMSENPCVRFPH